MDAASFDIHQDAGAGEARIAICGELDLASAPRLQRAAEKVLEGAPNRLVLDLSELGFIDSSGLRVIILLHERSLEEGWQLQVGRPPEPVLRIFQISRIDEHLNFVEEPAPGGAAVEDSADGEDVGDPAAADPAAAEVSQRPGGA